MSILTKEGIQKILNDDWLLMDDCEGLENCTVIKELARMTLVAMDSEPVAIIDQANLDYLRSGADADVWPPEREEMGDVLLYRHAQPAPVVPEEKPMPNPLSMYAVDAVAAIAEAKGWNACRAAMLQGKAEPVSLHPELSVWYGSMPESNGKINWTAILHRKGECLSTGITIELSEYPERVRYEADRVRHIIGELKEEPDILAYDADEHSGYVKPGNSPVIPDGKSVTASTGIPVIPDGYVIVPKEPTQAMCAAFNDSDYGRKSLRERYVAMLAAAPQEVK